MPKKTKKKKPADPCPICNKELYLDKTFTQRVGLLGDDDSVIGWLCPHCHSEFDTDDHDASCVVDTSVQLGVWVSLTALQLAVWSVSTSPHILTPEVVASTLLPLGVTTASELTLTLPASA